MSSNSPRNGSDSLVYIEYTNIDIYNIYDIFILFVQLLLVCLRIYVTEYVNLTYLSSYGQLFCPGQLAQLLTLYDVVLLIKSALV